MEADVASSIEDTIILMASYKNNTSQGKHWIFDSDSKKELFNNFLVTKEEEIVKMVDGLACEVIGTGTINVTGRDETVHALEAVRYVLKAR